MATPTHGKTILAPGVQLPDAQLSFTFSRSGGPGGQNVNKVNTKATLTVSRLALSKALPPYAMRRLETVASRYLSEDALQISADDSRSQLANRRACMDRLREVIVQAMHRPKVRRPTRPSRRANQRRIDAKKHRGQIKANRRTRRHD